MFALVKHQAGSGCDWILQQDIDPILRWMDFKSMKKFNTPGE
jgi:hypothetical protein